LPKEEKEEKLRCVFIWCKKSAVENPIFSFLRKPKEEIEMLMNIEMLQPDLKKSRKDSWREVFAPRVQNGIKTVQNCDNFFTISK
jgi:hypothetical protein